MTRQKLLVAIAVATALFAAIVEVSYAQEAQSTTTRKKTKARPRYFNPFALDASRLSVDRFGRVRLATPAATTNPFAASSFAQPSAPARVSAAPTTSIANLAIASLPSTSVAASLASASTVAVTTASLPETAFSPTTAPGEVFSVAPPRPPGGRPPRSPFRPEPRPPF